MSDLRDKVVAAISDVEWRGGDRGEIARAVIKVVLQEQINWTRPSGYNDFVRLVIRNFGLENDVEVDL